MKKKATKRRRHPDVALKIARGQLRLIRQYMNATQGIERVEASQVVTGPPRFIQCWTVTRGYSGVTQALDNSGQVWERVSLMEDVIDEDGKKGKRLKDSWWVPLSMQRREA